MNQIKSCFLSLNWKDIRRGLGIAFGAAITYLFSAMMLGTVPDVELLKSVGSVFVGAGGSYLVKNLFTNSSDEFLKKEPYW